MGIFLLLAENLLASEEELARWFEPNHLTSIWRLNRCHVSVHSGLRVMSMSAPVSLSRPCLHQSPFDVSVCTGLLVMSVFAPVSVWCHCLHHSPCISLSVPVLDNTGQQNFTFFFVPRGKISNPDSTFNTEFKYVSNFSRSPTVFLWQPGEMWKKCILISVSVISVIELLTLNSNM
jgi:hypothetical protein